MFGVRKVFSRVFGRADLQCKQARLRNGRRARAGLASESLERRRALSVNTIYSVEGGFDPWTSVVTDYGSDVYLSHIGDSNSSLLVSNNSSFRGTTDIASGLDADQVARVSRFNSTYEFLGVYEGEPTPANDKTIQAVSLGIVTVDSYAAGLEIHTDEFDDEFAGARVLLNGVDTKRTVSVIAGNFVNLTGGPLNVVQNDVISFQSGDASYPSYETGTNLVFKLPSDNYDPKLDSGSSITARGVLAAGELKWNFESLNQSSTLFRFQRVTDAGESVTLTIDGSFINQVDNFTDCVGIEFKNIVERLGIRPSDDIYLDITYDADVSEGIDVDIQVAQRGQGLLPVGSGSRDFAIVTLRPGQTVVPGVTRGVARFSSLGDTITLGFNVDPFGDVSMWLHEPTGFPDSYTNAQSRRARVEQLIQTKTIHDNNDTVYKDVQARVQASFDARTGVLTVTGDGKFGFEVLEVESAIYDPAKALATEVTLYNGKDHETGLGIGLPSPNSAIKIDSPVKIPQNHVEPNGIFDASINDVMLSATTIEVNAVIQTWQDFVVPDSTSALFGSDSEQVHVHAAVNAQDFDVFLSDREVTTTPSRSALWISRSGAFEGPVTSATARANRVLVEVEGGDIVVDGVIDSVEHTYIMMSAADDDSRFSAPFRFETGSFASGLGQIRGGNVLVQLGNDIFGEFFETTALSSISLDTDVDVMRVRAGSRRGDETHVPFPYDLQVREVGDLLVDSVSATSRDIALSTGGDLTIAGTMRSGSDIRLVSGGILNALTPIETSFGKIEIVAGNVFLQSGVRVLDTIPDERVTDIRVHATGASSNPNPILPGQLLPSLYVENVVAAINRIELVADAGTIGGKGIVIADRLKATAAENVVLHTDVHNADVVIRPVAAAIPGESGIVAIYETNYLSSTIENAQTAIVIANGYDEYMAIDAGAGSSEELLSPALYGDLRDTSNIFASAPHGSIDIEMSGSDEVTLGYLSSSDIGVVRGLNPIFDLEVMRAAGSVSITSTDAASIKLYDAPQAMSGADVVRFMTHKGVTSQIEEPFWNDDENKIDFNARQIDVEWNAGEAGFDYSHVEFTLPVRDVMELFGFEAGTLDGPPSAEQLAEWNEQFRPSDTVLLKDGIELRNPDLSWSSNLAANGLYQIASKQYTPSKIGDNTSLMTVRLVRMESFDQSPELSNALYVTVDAGQNGKPTHFVSTSGIGTVEPSAAGTDLLYTKIAVREVDSRPGFIPVKTVSTSALPGSYQRPIITEGLNQHFGKIVSRSHQSIDQASEAFGGVALKVGDLVLVQFGTDSDQGNDALPRSIANGIYRVSDVGRNQNSLGLNGAPWVLTRYEGADEIGNGKISQAFTGLAAVEQGWLRTRSTGKMFEFYYDAINIGDIKFQETKATQEFVKEGSEPSKRSDYFETVVDTELLGGRIELIVSQSLGGNTDAGTLGRMLDLLQQNLTQRSMVLSFDRELIEASSGENAPIIKLTEQLPAIVRPVYIDGNGVIIDGSGVEKTISGEELRIQEGGRYFGPVRPSEVFVARRRTLARAASYGDQADLNGLNFGTDTDGSIVKNLTIGGFENGAAIEIVGATNILLDDVQVGGGSETFELLRKRLPNDYGIRIATYGKFGDFITLQNVSAFDSSKAGISLGQHTQNVRILGATIGEQDFGNTIGISVGASEDVDLNRLGKSLPHSLGVYVDPNGRHANTSSARFSSGATKVENVGDKVFVTVPASLVSEGLQPGLRAYDRVHKLIWSVISVSSVADDPALVEVELKLDINETEGVFQQTELWPGRLEFGVLAKVEADSDEVLIEAFQIDTRDLYLGQELSFIEDNWFFGTPVIERITTPDLDVDESLEEGVYRLQLSEVAQNTGYAFVNLVDQSLRNTIAFNKDIGVQLSGSAVRIVRTDISETDGVGISVEGFEAWHTEVDEFIRAVPVIQIGGIGFNGVRDWEGPNQENVAVFANRGAGISIGEKVFEEVGKEILNVEDFEAEPLDESAILNLREQFQDYVLIAGNFIGTDVLRTPDLANGARAVKNIETFGLTGNTEIFKSVLFEGLAGDGEARFDHDGDGDDAETPVAELPTPITSEDFQSLPRYRAPLRPEDFKAEDFRAIYADLGILDPDAPLDAAKISELEALRGLDSMGNFFGFVPKYQVGDPADDDTVGVPVAEPTPETPLPEDPEEPENPGPSEPRPEPELWPGVDF